MTQEIDSLNLWIGKTEEISDLISLWPVQALDATLGASPICPKEGDALPPLWHWLYFKPIVPASGIGHDGHPVKGGFLPPVSLPRRMWAGGQLTWNTDNPLRIGQTATRHSRIEKISPKCGQSGPMVFVTIAHEIRNSHGLCITELQDIVYRKPSDGQSHSTQPAQVIEDSVAACWKKRYLPDEVMLFRYSALTFNSHRIHYDRPFATQFEGYPGLVVHGPLMATFLAELVRAHAPPHAAMQQFAFKGMAPAFEGHLLDVEGLQDQKRAQLWAQDNVGRRLMQAEVNFTEVIESDRLS